MAAHDYCTPEELKGALEMTGHEFADQDIERAISAASRGIDSACGRWFWKDTDATSRFYTPDAPDLLLIDDLIDLIAVEADTTGRGDFADKWVEGTDFVLEPLNAKADGKPWTTIVANGRRRFPTRHRAVRVTGKFGWAEVPSEVNAATVIVATKLLKRTREAPFGVVGFPLEGGAAVRIARTDPDVLFLIGHLVQHEVH